MQDPAVRHALEVREATVTNNWVRFMAKYDTVPNDGEYLMALYLDTARFEAMKAITRGVRPLMPVKSLVRLLGFVECEDEEENVADCLKWLEVK
jgi:hypothetical protein